MSDEILRYTDLAALIQMAKARGWIHQNGNYDVLGEGRWFEGGGRADKVHHGGFSGFLLQYPSRLYFWVLVGETDEYQDRGKIMIKIVAFGEDSRVAECAKTCYNGYAKLNVWWNLTEDKEIRQTTQLPDGKRPVIMAGNKI